MYCKVSRLYGIYDHSTDRILSSTSEFPHSASVPATTDSSVTFILLERVLDDLGGARNSSNHEHTPHNTTTTVASITRRTAVTTVRPSDPFETAAAVVCTCNHRACASVRGVCSAR
ncbi:unnamed protein product [Ectocarpus sp. 4 AP-2014]